jgi:ribosomal protein S18 acetylase RimI-like enzyme
VSPSNNGAQHLYLRIGFGDITILKEPMPSAASPAAK